MSVQVPQFATLAETSLWRHLVVKQLIKCSGMLDVVQAAALFCFHFFYINKH